MRQASSDKKGRRGWVMVTWTVLGAAMVITLGSWYTYESRRSSQEKQRRLYSLHRLYASKSGQPACPVFALDDLPLSPLAPNGLCFYDQSATCEADEEELAQAGIPKDTYCSALFEPGSCVDAARTYGVSASCLCSVVIAERSWSDHDLFAKRITDEAGLGATVGCIQQSPHTLYEAIQSLKKCQPQALEKFQAADLKSATPASLRLLMMQSCSAATELAALWLLAQAHPDCNGGQEGTCSSFSTNWNPGKGGLLNFGPQIRKKAELGFGILRVKPQLNPGRAPGESWALPESRMLYGPQRRFYGPPWPAGDPSTRQP